MKDPYGCEYYQELPVTDYYDTYLCEDCIKMEETTDWDAYEENKRQSIAEQNEY